MISATTAFSAYNRDTAAAVRSISKQRGVQQATESFRAAIAKVETVDDFLDDERIYGYALKAHGLEDMTYARALIRQVLVGGTASGSLSMRMTDMRFEKLARAFSFERDGTASLDEGVAEDTAAAFHDHELEVQAGNVNEGARLALYFKNSVRGIGSVWNILADRNLLKVVQTALRLPASMSLMSLDAQAALIEQKLDVADLADGEKLDRLLSAFTAFYDAEETTAADNPVVGLLATLRATQPAPSRAISGAAGIWNILAS